MRSKLPPMVSSRRAGLVSPLAYDSMLCTLISRDDLRQVGRDLLVVPAAGFPQPVADQPQVGLAGPGVLDVVETVRRGERQHGDALVLPHVEERLVSARAQLVPAAG